MPINAFVIGNGSKDAVERTDAQCLVRWNGRVRLQDRARSDHGEYSSDGEHFISHEVKAHVARLGSVKVECLDGLFNVGAQFVPVVTLSEDAFSEALGAKATVRLLRYLEDNFVHLFESKRLLGFEQVATGYLSKKGCFVKGKLGISPVGRCRVNSSNSRLGVATVMSGWTASSPAVNNGLMRRVRKT